MRSSSFRGEKKLLTYRYKKVLTSRRGCSKNRKKVVTSYMDSPLRIVLLLQNSYGQSFFFTKFWGIIKLFLSEYWCGNKLIVKFILYLRDWNPYNNEKLPASHGKVNSVQEACANCFVVHILKLEILQIPWKK